MRTALGVSVSALGLELDVAGGFQGFFEVFVGVGEGGEGALEPGGCEVDALGEHLFPVGGEGVGVGLAGLDHVGDRLVREVHGEGRGDLVDGHGLAFFGHDVGEGVCEGFGAGFEGVVVAIGEPVEGGQTGGHGHGVAGQGSGLEDPAHRGHVFHDLALAAVAAHGEASADDLAERGQVRGDAESLLRAAGGDAEAGDDLVEDEQRAVLCAQVAQSLKKAVLGQDETHVSGHGFHDDAGDVFAAGFEVGLDRVQVVVLGEQGVLGDFLGHAGGAGHGGGGGACGGQEGVGVAVVVADEFHELFAAGVAARQPQGGHGGLGARGDHAHHLHGRDDFGDLFGQGYFAEAGRAVAGAQVDGLVRGFGDRRVLMAQDLRPPGEDVVHVFAAVHVEQVRALGVLDEDRLGVHVVAGAQGGIHPAGHEGLGLGKERFGVHVAVLYLK